MIQTAVWLILGLLLIAILLGLANWAARSWPQVFSPQIIRIMNIAVPVFIIICLILWALWYFEVLPIRDIHVHGIRG
jgi:hypothetical protein